MSKLDDLLDAREVAEDDLKRYRALCTNLGIAAAAGVMLILIGALLVTVTALGPAMILVGAAASITAVICLVCQVVTAYGSDYKCPPGHRHPARRLEEADLAYRKAVREEA